MRPEFGLTQYLQSGLVSDSELSSQNVRDAHNAHTASALSFSPVSVSKGRETRRTDQSLGTLKATGELLGFLILRTCETSTVKGPGRVRHSTKLKTAGSTRRTVEPKLLRVDIDRHDDGRGLKPTRRVRSDVVERGRAAMRCTRIGRRRWCRPRCKGGEKASDARRVLKLQRCWTCLPTTSGRQVCEKEIGGGPCGGINGLLVRVFGGVLRHSGRADGKAGQVDHPATQTYCTGVCGSVLLSAHRPARSCGPLCLLAAPADRVPGIRGNPNPFPLSMCSVGLDPDDVDHPPRSFIGQLQLEAIASVLAKMKPKICPARSVACPTRREFKL